MWMILGVIFCLICLFFIIVMIRDSNRFVTVNYQIAAPGIAKKCRVVLLADLHNKQYGTDNQKLLDAIETASPDLILCAGDMMTSVPDTSTKPARKLVGYLAAKYPFYYSNGNHEYRIFHNVEKFGDMGEKYRTFLRENKVCLLENEKADLSSWGIGIYGLDLPEEMYKKLDRGSLSAGKMEEMLGKPSAGYNILLAHNPAFFETYADWGADLTLSGHVHGGVMRLPGIGGVLSTSFRLFPKYDGGLFEKEGRRMIISRGLGSHTVPVRIFNPAELVVIDLLPESKE